MSVVWIMCVLVVWVVWVGIIVERVRKFVSSGNVHLDLFVDVEHVHDEIDVCKVYLV